VSRYPQLFQTVLDTENARELAEFYRQLLGLTYREGDEQDSTRDDSDWLVLVDLSGGRTLAFQQVTSLSRTTWPTDDVPMQLHIDMTVPSVEELHEQRRRAEEPRRTGTAQPHQRPRRALVRPCRSRRAPVLHVRSLTDHRSPYGDGG